MYKEASQYANTALVSRQLNVLQFDFHVTLPPLSHFKQFFFHQVITRGRILRQWVKVQRVGVISSFRFKILPEMSPSSRLMVFFIGENGEVVTDSVLLEIDDGLPNKVDHIFMRGVKNHFKDTFVTK